MALDTNHHRLHSRSRRRGPVDHLVRARQEGEVKLVSCGACGHERVLPMIGWTEQLGLFLADHAPCRYAEAGAQPS